MGDKGNTNDPWWIPDWRQLLGEGYKEIFKAILLGVLGYLILLIGKQLPLIGDFLGRPLTFAFYQLAFWLLASLLFGWSMALLVERPRLRRLREDTFKDQLTGLMNPRAQNLKLPAEMRAARERQRTLDGENRDFRKDGLCAILLDIDNFKQVNDTVGYASGNFVLQQFAELLDSNRKVTDLVFRFGGDEFLILTPRTPPQGALIYADKLRSTVASTNFKVRDVDRNILLTICAGVTAMKYPDDDTQGTF